MDEWVLETIRVHARALLNTARRHSLCADDAQDAYQRGIEILLRRAGSVQRDTASNWLHTVVKHEAMAIRERRLRDVAPADLDTDGELAGLAPSSDERAGELSRLALAAEALTRLKPNQVRALVLRAEGHSYADIARATGWSATKVNRCIAEGRRAFRDRVAAIDSGAECRRWEPVLSAVADGEAGARELQAVRPHLRNCSGCRATLRAYREAPASIAVLVPAAALGISRDDGPGAFARLWDALAGGLHERAAMSGAKLSAGAEALTSTKTTAVALSATAIAGGGAALTGHEQHRQPVRAAVRPAASAQPIRPRPRRPPARPGPRRLRAGDAASRTAGRSSASSRRRQSASRHRAPGEFSPGPSSSPPPVRAAAASVSSSQPSRPPANRPARATPGEFTP